MEFLIGLGIVLLLVPGFLFVNFIMKLLPPEFSLGTVVFMLAVDGILAAVYYMSLSDILEDAFLFRRGIALGFGIATAIRVGYLMVKSAKQFKID